MVWAVLHYLEKRSDERTESGKTVAQREQHHNAHEVAAFDAATKVQQNLIETLRQQCRECHADLDAAREALHESRAELLTERAAWDFERRQLQQRIDGYEVVEGGRFSPRMLRSLADEIEGRGSV
jgi:hypothetical protein